MTARPGKEPTNVTTSAGRFMSHRHPLPADLRAVAFVHLVTGVGALLEVVVRLTQDHYQLNLGVLGIPICFGLLRRAAAWRSCALALLWMGLLLAPIAGFAGMVGSGPATFGVFGVPLGFASRGWLCVVAAALFLLFLWQYRVLVRPDVRSLFLGDRAPADRGRHPTGAPSGARG